VPKRLKMRKEMNRPGCGHFSRRGSPLPGGYGHNADLKPLIGERLYIADALQSLCTMVLESAN